MATFIKAGFWEKLCQKCTGYKGWLNLDKFVESKIPAPAYKVYTALLTQSGGQNDTQLFSGPLTIGVTYLIDLKFGNDDFTNVGAPNNNAGTYFVATGTTPANWSNGSRLRTDTGAPVVTVLENTIGNIWFTYYGVGIYIINSTDSIFLENKTHYTTSLKISNNISGDLLIVNAGRINDNEIAIESSRYPPPGGWENGLLFNTPIEIRVYS